ncbi:uncharacterized protein LOC144177999 [Haemaphysalis longicornis]
MTFGNERPTEQRKCRRIELWLRNQHSGNEVRVEALEVPHICCDVIPAPEMTTVAYLNEQVMEVADCSVDGSGLDEVGLLLGADYYWEVATGNIKRLQSGLVAVEMVFGWTLQGTTLKHHLDSVHNLFPATSEMLRDHLYVDDLVTGADNLEEAEKISRESQEIMHLAGMNLRKWKSNEFKLEEALSETDRTQSGFSDVTMTKILGVERRPESDDFVFEMNTLIDFLSKRQDTKRFLLQASARVFDPFGFLAPISTTAKVMFQSLWERGTDWDESLPPDIAETWDKWCHQLPMLRQIATPRLLARDLSHACTEVELHVFCDASPKAYGAVAYVKARTENGCTTVTH